jgi:hypothetical protein
MINAIKTAALLAVAVFAVTVCNSGKSAAGTATGAYAQAAESVLTAVQAKGEEAASQAAVTAQSAAPDASASAPASGLNGSWMMVSIPDLDGYYKLNNGSYESYNSWSGDLIISKGTYTVSGDIITFTQTHCFGGPFSLHYTSLYTKDEVKARYETSVEFTDELFEEFFPGIFDSSMAKYIPDANPDYDILISEAGITYKRILASGKVAAVTAARPPAPADFTINGTVLEKYNGNEKFVIIPEGITEIGRWAFRENKTITNVVIPATVTLIRAGAFLRCTGLTSVHIPEGVTLIGSGAFYECTSLARVTIPETVTQIDEFAFQKCTGIKRLEIPATVTWIGQYTFSDWTSSQTIIIRGKTEEEADAAWGPAQNGEYWWRGNCNAKIFYTS